MDGSRFDAIARSLAGTPALMKEGTSRRGFVGALGGAALAALGRRGAAAATCEAACAGLSGQTRDLCLRTCTRCGKLNQTVCPVARGRFVCCDCPVAGQERCAEVCVDPATAYLEDPDNCGGCGAACPAEAPFCAEGACLGCRADGDCAEGWSCCGAVCVNTFDDEGNCGACGQVCPNPCGSGNCNFDGCVDGSLRSCCCTGCYDSACWQFQTGPQGVCGPDVPCYLETCGPDGYCCGATGAWCGVDGNCCSNDCVAGPAGGSCA